MTKMKFAMALNSFMLFTRGKNAQSVPYCEVHTIYRGGWLRPLRVRGEMGSDKGGGDPKTIDYFIFRMQSGSS